MLRYMLCLPKWLLICVVLAIAFSFPPEQRAIFEGISIAALEGELDLLQIGKWTALCSIPLLADGVIWERSRQIELFCRVRVNKAQLRLGIVSTCAFCATVWAICICGTAVWRLGVKNGIQFFLLFLPNQLLWSAVGLVGYTRSKKAAWSSCIPIALIGGFCLIGSYFPKLLPYLPSTWGMLSIALPCKGLWTMPFASFLSAIVFYLVFIIYEEKQNGNY